LLHLLAQGLHLGDGQAGIVSYDDNSRSLEDLLEKADELLLFRSFHVALSGCSFSIDEKPTVALAAFAGFGEPKRLKTTLKCLSPITRPASK